VVSPWSERMNASSAVASRRSSHRSKKGPQHRGGAPAHGARTHHRRGGGHTRGPRPPQGGTTPQGGRRGVPHHRGHQHTGGGLPPTNSNVQHSSPLLHPPLRLCPLWALSQTRRPFPKRPLLSARRSLIPQCACAQCTAETQIAATNSCAASCNKKVITQSATCIRTFESAWLTRESSSCSRRSRAARGP